MNKTFFDIDKKGYPNGKTLFEKENQMVGAILHTTDQTAIIKAMTYPTEQQFRLLSNQLFGGRYTYRSPFLGHDKPIIVHCNRHDLDFAVTQASFHVHGLLAQVCPLCEAEMREREFQAERIEEVRPEIERIMRRPLQLAARQAAPAPSQDDYDTLLTAFAMKGEA